MAAPLATRLALPRLRPSPEAGGRSAGVRGRPPATPGGEAGRETSSGSEHWHLQFSSRKILRCDRALVRVKQRKSRQFVANATPPASPGAGSWIAVDSRATSKSVRTTRNEMKGRGKQVNQTAPAYRQSRQLRGRRNSNVLPFRLPKLWP